MGKTVIVKMLHGDFKPGEICKTSGPYVCRTCAGRKIASRITMEQGGTFPLCATCAERGALEIDTVWKLEGTF
jgi:hypothetical protein